MNWARQSKVYAGGGVDTVRTTADEKDTSQDKPVVPLADIVVERGRGLTSRYS